MTEHWFMTVMLAVVGLDDLVYRKSEQIEGVTAAIYLEARKILSQLG